MATLCITLMSMVGFVVASDVYFVAYTPPRECGYDSQMRLDGGNAFDVRSKLTCARSCRKNETCVALNVCPSGATLICQLFDEFITDGGTDLVSAPGCSYFEQVTVQ